MGDGEASEMRIVIYEQSSGGTLARPSTLCSHVSGVLAGVSCYVIPSIRGAR